MCKSDLSVKVSLKLLCYSLLLLLQKFGSRFFDKEFILYVHFIYRRYYQQNNEFKSV